MSTWHRFPKHGAGLFISSKSHSFSSSRIRYTDFQVKQASTVLPLRLLIIRAIKTTNFNMSSHRSDRHARRNEARSRRMRAQSTLYGWNNNDRQDHPASFPTGNDSRLSDLYAASTESQHLYQRLEETPGLIGTRTRQQAAHPCPAQPGLRDFHYLDQPNATSGHMMGLSPSGDEGNASAPRDLDDSGCASTPFSFSTRATSAPFGGSHERSTDRHQLNDVFQSSPLSEVFDVRQEMQQGFNRSPTQEQAERPVQEGNDERESTRVSVGSECWLLSSNQGDAKATPGPATHPGGRYLCEYPGCERRYDLQSERECVEPTRCMPSSSD